MEKEYSVKCHNCKESYGVDKDDFKEEIVVPERDPNVLYEVLSSSGENRGHPLKGESREKTPLQAKEVSFFAWLRPLHQNGLVFTPFRTRYFSLIGSQSAFADPHQSPIGIKAIVLL